MIIEAERSKIQPKRMRIGEAAKRAGTTRTVIRSMIVRGHLRALRIGRHYLIHPNDLDAFIERNLTKESA